MAAPDVCAIRNEVENDREAVYSVNLSSFETPAEADLVDELRQKAHPVISLVAENLDGIVGHIMFSPVLLANHPELRLMGLAPMAVSPAHQRKGIGSALVRAGIEKCRGLEVAAVVVLGHPGYYPRFGFEPSTRFGIKSVYDVPEDVFMAMELRPKALRGKTGTVRYHPAFGKF